MSVEPRPASMTSAPWAVAPRANAATSGGEDVRMSWVITISPAPVSRMKAAPAASATSSLSSPGTTPRMSYALMIFDKSVTAPPVPCPDALRRLGRRGEPGFVLAALPAGYGTKAQSLPPPGSRGGRSASTAFPASGRGLAAGRLAGRSGPRRGRADHSEVTAAAYLDALPDRLRARRDRGQLTLLGRLTDGVGQGLQVVHALLDGVSGQPDDIPAPGHGEPLGVLGAQVVAVRLDVGGQRAEHRGGVTVDVRERVDRGLPACGARAATRTHRPTSLT